jgi:DNA invertase Pin-like site-specific DNA recombinase
MRDCEQQNTRHPSQTRAALYLRVSTQRQADQQVSLPDQHRHGIAYCQAHGYEVVAVYVEEGASALHDRRPEFRQMIEAALTPARPFDLIIVHSFSRFFRDHFEFELYVRKLARNGVELMSITQDVGDDPAHMMMRRVIALFDEYQSKENAKHVMRALKENARQGFWCGSTPPIGYRVVVAEERGHTLKKKLAIDPEYADLVREVYRLALRGCSGSGPMGVKMIASHINKQGFTTQNGAQWQTAQIHRMLTRRTYMGEHIYNRRCKGGTINPRSEMVIVPVPPLVNREDFEAVQTQLRRRAFKVTPNKAYGPTPYLKGRVHCSLCGGLMKVRSAKGKDFRYYTCLGKLLPDGSRCPRATMPAPELERLVNKFVRQQILRPKFVAQLFEDAAEDGPESYLVREAAFREVASNDADLRLCRLYEAIEAGVVAFDDASVMERIDTLRETRADHLRSLEELARLQSRVTAAALKPSMIERAVRKTKRQIRDDPATLKKLVTILAERVDVGASEIRLTCVKSRLLDAIFHVGEGTIIADVDWRRDGALQPQDCITYKIARP